jgi:hypothetical protein
MTAWWRRTAGDTGWAHPSDIDLLTELLARGEAGPALPEHVAACATCSARWRALASTLEGDRVALAAAADAYFPADRLERQRRHVARRIEHGHRAARVLRFPVMAMRDTPRRRAAHRSVAAAALLGLIVGTLAGRLLDRHAQAPGAAVPAAVSAADPDTETMAQAAVTPDEAFLSELDHALASPRPAPLSALDALTPQVAGGR